MGDVVLVGLQAELSACTGAELKKRSPFSDTVVMTMVNGAAKYLSDERSYHRITCEAMASHYARGAEELVAVGILSFLGALR